jgi:hypothetical protein
MHPPVPRSASAGHVIGPIRQQGERVVERVYDQAGRLRCERIRESVAEEWTVEEADPDHLETASNGCLMATANAVICAALFIGLAVIGATAGHWMGGPTGAAIGLVSVVIVGLWWVQRESTNVS